MDILTQEQIQKINSSVDSWNQGVFEEPSNIDTNEKRLVVYQRYETGGVSGGSCWDSSNPQYYTNNEVPDWNALDLVLQELKPNISYLTYKNILKNIRTSEDTEYEYYGNRTEYFVQWIALEDLYNLLK